MSVRDASRSNNPSHVLADVRITFSPAKEEDRALWDYIVAEARHNVRTRQQQAKYMLRFAAAQMPARIIKKLAQGEQ